MNTNTLSLPQAQLKLAMWNADAAIQDSSALYLWLKESGLPDELAIRLYDLVSVTRRIGDKVISIGKIVLMKIIEFAKAHPNLLIGMAIGAAISTLVQMIPFLGQILAPAALAVGVVLGGVAGQRLDQKNQGEVGYRGTDILGIAQDLLEICQDFFKLMIEIFNAVFQDSLA